MRTETPSRPGLKLHYVSQQTSWEHSNMHPAIENLTVYFTLYENASSSQAVVTFMHPEGTYIRRRTVFYYALKTPERDGQTSSRSLPWHFKQVPVLAWITLTFAVLVFLFVVLVALLQVPSR